MSTCPEKELISVYIDGEMPEKFVKDYEQHLFNCSDCWDSICDCQTSGTLQYNQ